MKTPLGICFAMGLATVWLSPGAALSGDLVSGPVSSVEIGSTYLSEGGYNVAETNWRGYNQGFEGQGFNCHKVTAPAGMEVGGTVYFQSVQCYDRIGNAYIVPGSAHIVRLD